MLAIHRVVGSPGLAWKNQSHVVTVAFNGGSDDLYALIENTAKEWTNLGGQLQFSFKDNSGHYRQWSTSDNRQAANLRISFTDGDGFWSLLGVLAKNVAPNEPTMNFEGFPTTLQGYFHGQNTSQWLKTYEHSTILHEFGHALGLSHEHFHPQCQTDLKIKTIIIYLQGPPNNWSEQQARFNMDAAYYFDALGRRAGPLDSHSVTSPRPDQASVMLYSFPADFYDTGNTSICKSVGDSGKDYPTTLSAGDKAFYLVNYK